MIDRYNKTMTRPDYRGGSIVNLMTSIIEGRGGEASLYPPLRYLDPALLHACTNVVLLVIDGLGHHYLMETGRGSTLQQHCQSRITSVFPSTTATAITSFLTGVAPQQHGLTGWFTYFKELGDVIAVLPFRSRHGMALLSREGVDAARLFGHTPVFDRLGVRSYVVTPQRIVDTDFNRAHTGRAETRSYTSLPQMFKLIKQTLRENKKQKYIYAYWPDLDGLAHEHGIGSMAVSAHFAELDAAFSRFLHAIEGSNTMVIVTADHGIIDSDPARLIELDDHPQLAETLVLPLCGDRRLAYCYIKPAKQDRFEDYVQTELGEAVTLFSSEELLAQGYFGLGEPHPRLRDRIGDYALVMKQNYTIKDWVLGEKHHVHIGAHGGLSEEEMYVPLIVVQC